MDGKEKVIRALEYKEGPVPIDFGGFPTTGIHCSIVEKMRDYYGLEKKPVTIHEPYQMLGLIDDDLKEVLGVDSEIIWSPYTFYGFKNENWKEWKTPWGQVVLVAGDFNVTTSGSGEILMYPEGDMSASPSAVMPEGGYFFDSLSRQHPIDDDNLNPEDNLEEFGPVGDDVLSYYAEQVERLSGSSRFIVANFGGTAIGDIACVPAPALKDPKGIRDVTEWYISTSIRQDYLHEVFDRQTDLAIDNLEKIYSVVGDAIGAAYICGNDFGSQNGPLSSPESFRELYMPYYKKVNGWIHKNTKWKTFKHSCGGIEPFMEGMIESGFDIINPLQFSAAGMDPELIKENYGKRIAFWGGGVDTQRTLPFGTPEEVRHEVLERCRILSDGGGYIFNSIHNIQAMTPIENMAAMFDAVGEFNKERGF
ncbi:MAG: uroporphyrinogen decarboxylase family protein [Spirochaetales bacterium]|nr:uroporphyrinogen decarboxylase family protein [Spirochaetales bacterium]